MKHFYLLENNRHGKLPGVRELIEEYIINHGGDITVTNDLCADEIPDGIECLIIMGGDGTMMRAADRTAGMEIPIIGINVGNLGYLTSVSEKEEIIPMLEKILNGEYNIEKHCLLTGTWKDSEGIHMSEAFNDIIISRRASKAIRIRVAVNGELLNEYLADGIIVSTPNGSTAYNLAAGGPIVQAGSDVIVLTPICPHAFMARSVVLGLENKIEISVIDGKKEDGTFAEAAFDGKIKGRFGTETTITIEKSGHTVPMIRLKDDSYIKNLRKKMNHMKG